MEGAGVAKKRMCGRLEENREERQVRKSLVQMAVENGKEEKKNNNIKNTVLQGYRANHVSLYACRQLYVLLRR